MSKYIKLEDAIGMFGRSGKYHADAIVDMLFYLPTIEVSEEQLSKLQASENSVENTTASEDFTSISRANSKLEVSEDCISREYILSQAFASNEYNRETKAFDLPVVSVEDIEDAPSVVPSRAEGEWIRGRYWSRGAGMGEEYGFFYKCSLCEYEVEGGYTRCGFNGCPNCRAKMKG